MPRPIVSDIAERQYEGLLPLAYEDDLHNWALLHFSESFIGGLQLVEDLIRYDETIDAPGWSLVLDVDRAPYYGLPWLGQFVGVTTPAQLPGESQAAHDARSRTYIRDVGGFQRGTPAAIRGAVQQFLTGTKTVNIYERDTSPYHFAVTSKDTETNAGDVAAITAAIRAVKPAGLQFTYNITPAWTYNNIDAAYATYNAIDAGNTNYNDIDNGP